MADKRTLLRSQRRRVFQMLREAGLEPADFSWSKQEIAGGIVVSKLSYREGTYYCPTMGVKPSPSGENFSYIACVECYQTSGYT